MNVILVEHVTNIFGMSTRVPERCMHICQTKGETRPDLSKFGNRVHFRYSRYIATHVLTILAPMTDTSELCWGLLYIILNHGLL